MSWNVDIYEVGVQQVKEFAAQNFYPGGLGGCFELLDEGVYLVVECCAHFGRVSTPCVHYCFQNVQQATYYVLYQDSVQNDPKFMDDHDQVVGYEIWHVVDDAELWQVWEHDVAVSKRRRNEPTGWHVYHGGACVLDVESVPTCLYRLRCVTANYEGVSDGWYTDAHGFADALGMRGSRGWMPWHSFVRELGDCVTILDDDCLELDDYGDGTVLTVVCRESC